MLGGGGSPPPPAPVPSLRPTELGLLILTQVRLAIQPPMAAESAMTEAAMLKRRGFFQDVKSTPETPPPSSPPPPSMRTNKRGWGLSIVLNVTTQHQMVSNSSAVSICRCQQSTYILHPRFPANITRRGGGGGGGS